MKRKVQAIEAQLLSAGHVIKNFEDNGTEVQAQAAEKALSRVVSLLEGDSLDLLREASGEVSSDAIDLRNQLGLTRIKLHSIHELLVATTPTKTQTSQAMPKPNYSQCRRLYSWMRVG